MKNVDSIPVTEQGLKQLCQHLHSYKEASHYGWERLFRDFDHLMSDELLNEMVQILKQLYVPEEVRFILGDLANRYDENRLNTVHLPLDTIGLEALCSYLRKDPFYEQGWHRLFREYSSIMTPEQTLDMRKFLRDTFELEHLQLVFPDIFLTSTSQSKSRE